MNIRPPPPPNYRSSGATESKVSKSPVADGDVSTEDVSVSNDSLEPTVSGSQPIRNRRPPVWMKDYIHS